MTTDDDFTRDLRTRLDSAIPPLTVRTDRVLPRARRRRAATRSAQVSGAVGALALVAVTAVAGWSGDGLPWQHPAAPAGTVSLDPTPAATDAPTAPVAAPAAPVAADAGTTPAAGSIADAEGHTYWYVRSEGTGPGGAEVSESWYSLTQPGIGMSDDDPGTAFAFGPKWVIGRFVIDGVLHDTLDDVSLLPTDPDALRGVLEDSVEPDRGAGSDEQKVFDKITELLTFSPGLLPHDLRAAAWQAAAGLPGVTVTASADSTGRPGEVLDFDSDAGTHRLVLDPATALVLEQSTGESVTVYTTMGPADGTPIEPTLELAGCTRWDTC